MKDIDPMDKYLGHYFGSPIYEDDLDSYSTKSLLKRYDNSDNPVMTNRKIMDEIRIGTASIRIDPSLLVFKPEDK